MKIEDYIQKHGLVRRKIADGAWIPEFGVPDEHDAEYYTSDDAFHVVVIDATGGKFKVIHEEPMRVETDWLDRRTSYETDARPFW